MKVTTTQKNNELSKLVPIVFLLFAVGSRAARGIHRYQQQQLPPVPTEQTSKWDSYESTVPSPEMLMTPSEREEYLNDL